MPRERVLLLLLVLVVLPLAGCGGGEKTYSAAKSRACLVNAGHRVTGPPASDVVASAAEGGAFSTRFGLKNLVTVSFGLDRNGAERIVRAYQRFHGKNIGLPDVLHAEHNAVLLWAAHPDDEYVQTVDGCLR